MLLPNASGSVGEMAVTAPFKSAVATDLAETTWCAYAWPANHGNSGNRTFFVSQTGDITSTDHPAYAGSNAMGSANTLTPDAAYIAGSSGLMTAPIAIGTFGHDTRRWRQVN